MVGARQFAGRIAHESDLDEPQHFQKAGIGSIGAVFAKKRE